MNDETRTTEVGRGLPTIEAIQRGIALANQYRLEPAKFLLTIAAAPFSANRGPTAPERELVSVGLRRKRTEWMLKTTYRFGIYGNAHLLRIALLLLCSASALAHAFEDDTNIFCGRLKGTHYNHSVTFTCGVNLSYGITEWFAINAAYLNEGHPQNHHRDGFAIQPSLYKDFNKWRVQLSTGPYYSMDTTQLVDGTVLNDKHLGVLSSVALKWHPTQANWYVGIGYNNVWMPNKLNSNSEVLFLGTDMAKDGGGGYEDIANATKTKISLWVGPGNTTNSGSKIKTAGQIEINAAVPIELPFEHPLLSIDHFSYSLAALYEGNTLLTDRKGGMAQLWYNGHFGNQWTLSGGAGPYLEHDSLRDKRATNLAVVASVRAMHQLTGATAVGLNFNRVISFYNRDADIFLLGIQRAF